MPIVATPVIRAPRRWLLFVHQLPPGASNLRVRTWRRLQQMGAIPIKQAVYVLPDTPGTREDFEWLTTEVRASGGDVSVFSADHVDAWSDDALVDEFRRAGQDAYAALARDIEKALKRTTASRRPRGRRRPTDRLINVLRERMNAISNIDFFASAGRDRVASLLTQLETHRSRRRASASLSAESTTAGGYHGRLWVTRPRPGVDRMACAWLIRQFIDQQARFGFAADRDVVPAGAVPFDMFGVEFSHQGDGCSFETLCAVFTIRDPAVARIAALVHDLDLKDGRFGAPEASAVSAVIEGLQLTYSDDETLLTHGMALFDALFRSFAQAARSAGPRIVAKSPKRSGSRRG